MDSTQNFGENSMNLNMNNNQFFMNNQIRLNNNQTLNQNLIQNPMINQYNSTFYNMYQNNNNMILNNQMMNMNQMMMNIMINNNKMNQNFMNKNNNTLNDDNIYNLDKDRLNLINSIIEFYKENDMYYMNFKYPNQIKGILNLLNENYSKFRFGNTAEDPLFYIKGPKINIIFINSNYEIKKVKIPISITQYDLYTVANLCKRNYCIENILLIHKNKVLKKDESSIYFISDNDNILIIEPFYFPDNSYYNSLMKKSSNEIYNVSLTFQDGRKFNRIFPSDITIGEMCISFYLIFGLSNNHYFIERNVHGLRIGLDDKRKLKEFKNPIILEERVPDIIGLHINILGKPIKFTLYSNLDTLHPTYIIGILNKIEDIMIYYEKVKGRKIKQIKIEQIEIKNNEEKRLCSLLSLGITNDFDCYIEFGEKLI